MLDSLHIENIAVIEKADVSFSGGFTVLTGETGAGKSIIIDSINAVLGERTSKELIRTGCDTAVVTAVFSSVSKQVSAKLKELGVFDCDDEIIITRTLTQSKSVAKINGQTVTAFVLRTIAPLLVNIHGQHDSGDLFISENHYKYIDLLAKNKKEISAYKSAFLQMLKTRKIVKLADQNKEETKRKLELLKFQIDEIESADIKIGEKERLEKRKAQILNSQKISDSLYKALELLSGDENVENSGACNALSTACNELYPVTSFSQEIAEISDKISEISYSLDEVKQKVEQLIEETGFEQKELSETEERLDLFYSFEGKYGDNEEEIIGFLENAKREYNELLNSDEQGDEARLVLPKQIELVKELGAKVTKTRENTARLFEKNVTNQMKYLHMPNAKFSVSISKCAYSNNGADEIEFLISTNPGEPFRPLTKIASGGEMSRIMLSIKNVLSESDPVETLIFDEIDSGISGNAATKVGEKLKETSIGKQVVCVTHLAQIAAKADSHLLIMKKISSGKAVTDVKLLSFDERKAELARIIGSRVTDANLKSAEEMLNL